MSVAKTAETTIATRTRPKSQRGSGAIAISARQNSWASRTTAERGAAGARSSGLMSVVSATIGAPLRPSSGVPPGGRDSTLRAICNPRVHEGVGEINKQVDQYIGERREQHDPLYHRIIFRKDTCHGKLSDAGPEEDRLDGDGARQEGAGLQPHERQGREESVRERMAGEWRAP